MMTFGITANTGKQFVRLLLPDVMQWFSEKGVPYVLDERTAQHLGLRPEGHRRLNLASLCAECDMVLTFGGDGTILSTVREFGARSIPILGVKIGGMGFLADLAPAIVD